MMTLLAATGEDIGSSGGTQPTTFGVEHSRKVFFTPQDTQAQRADAIPSQTGGFQTSLGHDSLRS